MCMFVCGGGGGYVSVCILAYLYVCLLMPVCMYACGCGFLYVGVFVRVYVYIDVLSV